MLMPTTLTRRLRRIGSLKSIKDAEGQTVRTYDPDMTPEDRAALADLVREMAVLRRRDTRTNRRRKVKKIIPKKTEAS